MRLKRLEIQGFKSFAQPVCLEFGPGVTAIVGPNGSGKSNISDALRWVLGEHNIKSLRGSKLEDIIFAGSDGKRPLGMAEVQLTLDNSEGFLPVDYAEVTVARRVYRSGDSEFFINKQNCRLKDIQDLFTDTGLGRESYAVVGQGQIDQVLSVRSEDRRVLLEETAGIIKYRQRKEQALRKLEETSVDLLRVTDVLHELESQLGPLEEQAKQARLYLSLAEELREAELDHFHLSWQNLSSKLTKVEEDYQHLQVEYEQGTEYLEELEIRAAKLETEEQALQAEIEARQQELTDLVEAYNKTVHSIELHQERIKNQDARAGQLEALIGAKQEELRLLTGERDKLQQELDAIKQELHAQEQAVRQAYQALEGVQGQHRRAQADLEKLKDEFFEFMRELADQRNFQRSFSERRSSLEEQLSRSAQELAFLQERLIEIDTQLQDVEKRSMELQELSASQEEQERSLQGELSGARAALAELEQRRRRLESAQAGVISRLKTLKELEEGYEGYGQGVRRILQDGRMSKLVLGTVADVIQVPQGLETAFEVALGAGLQNLITVGEEEAKALIAWLQKVQGGRVTILPLDSVRGAEFSPQVKSFFQAPGVLGSALDLLSFSEEYRPALASLLGRVVITEDLETALQLKKRVRQFSRIVTRDGSVVFPTGAITGGSINTRTSGLLTRKGELARLEKEADDLAGELEGAAAERSSILAQISQGEQRAVKLQQEQVQTKLALQGAAQDRAQVLRERERLEAGCQDLSVRIEELQVLQVNLGSECELAAAQVGELEAEEQRRREQIQAQEAALVHLAGSVESLAHQHTQEQVRLAELKGVLENRRMHAANLEQRISEAQGTAGQAQGDLDQIAADRLQNEQYIKDAGEANAKRRQQQKELQAALDFRKQERHRVQQERAQLGQELIQVQKDQLRRERALYRLETELSQLQSGQEQIREALTERGLSLASIVNREVQKKEAALKRSIEDLRSQIRDLGLVNPTAAEEYERVVERCSFLQDQLADLNEARASLMDVINEMDKLCRTRLREVFDQVRQEFQTLFTWLFQGGSADLVLTDPESILTTGIDVLARPPGKKLQNLLLLSGGERALTAIALLFAIRRVKPVPFWVLDEIDATLDESNLERFSALMQEFSQDTQFLVITHRTRTMENADTLYGVTMGDQGVSQIISVALNRRNS
ncbi:MAG TPA: chromosome segregation protein SMC [Firmicutes bacterium]|jgi:chromosome segregation protein|nr:chromosome segregation protein SMC [Bacillota bacterium]HHT41985.1 chromosome segregation protein SMC [Bacillota bacterium]